MFQIYNQCSFFPRSLLLYFSEGTLCTFVRHEKSVNFGLTCESHLMSCPG